MTTSSEDQSQNLRNVACGTSEGLWANPPPTGDHHQLEVSSQAECCELPGDSPSLTGSLFLLCAALSSESFSCHPICTSQAVSRGQCLLRYHLLLNKSPIKLLYYSFCVFLTDCRNVCSLPASSVTEVDKNYSQISAEMD